MADEKRNGRTLLATAGVIVGMIAGPFAVWGTLNAEAGRQKEKIEQLEKRQAEDRKEVKEQLRRIEAKTENTDKNVQEIRILLERMGRDRGQR